MLGIARTLRRLTPAHFVRGGEWLLVVLIAFALSRLFWLMATPLSPVGDWKPPLPSLPDAAAQSALLDSFDPFAIVAGDETVATATDLTLFGVRQSGPDGGGAIIGLPDGTQASFAIGEEIVPGVTLSEVHYSHVILDRGGARQQLSMEGGDDVPSGSPVGIEMNGTTVTLPLSLRTENGKVTGIKLTGGDPTMLAAAGLKPGDVVVAIANAPVDDAADLDSLKARIKPGARIPLSVERGAGVIPVTLSL